MKIIGNKIIPTKDYAAINLFGVIFARKECLPLSERTINHEKIHTAQMKEMIYILFYVWYGIEWIVRLIQYKDRNKAYYNISFEREAYANDQDLSYLSKRSLFSWCSYLFSV